MTSPDQRPEIPESFRRELTYQTFRRLGYDTQASISTLAEARRIGVFTCADALAIGLDYLVEQSSKQAFSRRRGKPAFVAAVRQLCGEEMPYERALPNEWAAYYRDLRDATPALLLPASGDGFQLNTYHDLDPLHREMNIGQLLNPDFREHHIGDARDRVYAMRLTDAAAYNHRINELELTTRGLVWFAEEVAAPAVAAFNLDRQTGTSSA